MANKPNSKEGPGYEAQMGTKDGTDLNVDLGSVPVKVENVKFDGLSRTKNDYLLQATKRIFYAKNFEELILNVGEAQKDLRGLGIFSEVGTLVDTYKHEDRTPDSYEVIFLVKELNRLNGGVNTMVGANEGVVQLGLRMPNLFGRGEKVQIDHMISSSYNRKTELSFNKPFPYVGSNFGTSIFYTKSPNPWSGIHTSSFGTVYDYTFKLQKETSCSAQWHGIWRHLTVLPRGTSGSDLVKPDSGLVKEYLGHSVKSSLKFIYAHDTRDQIILPSNGVFRKASVEFAGLFGDAKFVKLESDLQFNKSISNDWTVFQASLRSGILQPLSMSPISSNISDFFFLGGSQNLRGFDTRGVGPRSGSDVLGGKVYWASAFHIFTRLPFVKNNISITDNMRLHGFVNFGSLSNNLADCCIMKNIRVAYGLGLAYRMGNMARLELNYCFPLKSSKGDRLANGLQFGLGLEFL